MSAQKTKKSVSAFERAPNGCCKYTSKKSNFPPINLYEVHHTFIYILFDCGEMQLIEIKICIEPWDTRKLEKFLCDVALSCVNHLWRSEQLRLVRPRQEQKFI